MKRLILHPPASNIHFPFCGNPRETKMKVRSQKPEVRMKVRRQRFEAFWHLTPDTWHMTSNEQRTTNFYTFAARKTWTVINGRHEQRATNNEQRTTSNENPPTHD
ncbi:MAG: hypothetical protein FJY10_09585 [Bacteroidetes bacterium]|nr:hypothetical protein [Bacteroidota bacterium]